MSSTENSLITFSSSNRIGLIRSDGTGERFLDFDLADQVNWQTGPQFADGRRIVLHSFETGPTWEGNVKTHVWIYDLQSGDLREILTRERPAPFLVCAAILPGEKRVVINPVIDGEQRILIADLDGADPIAITHPEEGFAYGIALSPDGHCLAFHITPYRILTHDLHDARRSVVARHPDHLYFGPAWSPDGRWLAYQDCHFTTDPGHDWADLCIGAPDGSTHRVVTTGLRQWFCTSFGPPEAHGNGSNSVEWSPDGATLTYTQSLPDTNPPWKFQPQRPDTDHFNRDYKPDEACGGTQICLLDPFSGRIRELTAPEPHEWNFRPAWSPDGKRIAFSRARTGTASELWIMDADGGNQQLLTRGLNGRGADFARWLKSQRT